MGREEWNNVLKGKVMEFRGITTNPHQAAQDREQLLHDRRVEKAEHDRMIWEGLRSTESVQPYITRRMLEAQSQDCKLLNEMKQKEISEIMIKKNAEIEQKLGFFLDRQHFEEESRAKRTVALRQNDPELMKFARAVRSRAVGIMQRSQAIATELKRKMKKAEEDRIEREWMDALIASEQERECQERIAKYKVKQEFAKCVHDQLRDKMTLRCGDFQKEKHRCETVVAKELAELQAEKDLALKRKLELRDIFLAELERRRQARKDANKGEHEFILKKQQEMQEIEDFKDYKKDNYMFETRSTSRLSLVSALTPLSTKSCVLSYQVRAADQLVALKAAHDEELHSRAEKAAEQMAIDKTVLHSSMERDDIFREPFERLEREADAESTRVYLEACDRQNELYKHRDELRRQNGLDTGECLRVSEFCIIKTCKLVRPSQTKMSTICPRAGTVTVVRHSESRRAAIYPTLNPLNCI
ncbi:unnamed protein product [Dibothriocephalus latus]|uniref:Trichohyalin-plectin-homology domain-containing protein n=1 Tax=Dibothriocephalus latus TaxID=60516 RepID=A0A3P6SKR4_DIBLA|nr:unnamed protein product [Dibothriocephalus latus]